jgi:phospholipid/cholesterol/gamma-HCH transport system permease protein
MKSGAIACPAALDQQGGAELMRQVREGSARKGEAVILDFSRTESMDSLGGAWLLRLADLLRERGATLEICGATGHVKDYLDLLGPSMQSAAQAPRKPMGTLEKLGDTTIRAWKEFREFMDLVVDALYWTLMAPFEGRGFRWGLLLDEIYEMGNRAVVIVCLMNFLLGLIIAMLMAKQAEKYGFQIFVADLVVIGFARELAAIMTAVVVSARTGAAIAAELATMKVQEEIDALRGMGLNVAQFLVAPKVLALLIVLPCLTVLGMVAGLAGGALWGIFVLGFQSSVWFDETLNAAYMSDLYQGMSKTVVFAIFIVLIGCHNGLRVSGGSRGVGLMTTRAVVMDIFMLISVDIVFATLFYYVLE